MKILLKFIAVNIILYKSSKEKYRCYIDKKNSFYLEEKEDEIINQSSLFIERNGINYILYDQVLELIEFLFRLSELKVFL
jgi:hypothetical protein